MVERAIKYLLQRSDFRVHQERALKFVLITPRGALWLDMGLGKTSIVLTAVAQLLASFEVGRVLVVGPKRVARKVWTDERDKWQHLNHLTIETMHGATEQREAALSRYADIHTISFDNLQWLTDHYRKKGGVLKKSNPWPWDMVVIDEASAFKNRETIRWKAMFRIVRATTRFVELTGSPAPNGLIDIWAPMFFIDFGERLGRSLGDFRARWFHKEEYSFRWKPWEWAEIQIHKKLRSRVLSMKAEDWLDLPPVLTAPVYVDMTPDQAKQYQLMSKKYWTDLSGQVITAVNAGVAWGKCLQLANGACYFDDERHFETFHDHKLGALRELLEASQGAGQPVLLFYSYWHDLERIKPLLKRLKLSYRTLDTVKDEDDWNAGKLDVLMMHPASGGHGLNLQDGGETIIWFGLNPSLELFSQANARLMGGLRRLGKSVIIHIILTRGTVDDDVVVLLEDKKATQDSLFEATKRYL